MKKKAWRFQVSMIEILDQQCLEIQGIPLEYLKVIKKKLSLENPEYIRKIKMKTPMWGTKRYIEYFRIKEGVLYTPTGFLNTFLSFLKKYNLIYVIRQNKNYII